MVPNAYKDNIRHQQDQLAIQYLPAVKALVYKMKENLPPSIEASELISIATEELIKLARKYDSRINDNFWGYARTRVQGSILDYLRSLDTISRNNRKIVKDVAKEVEKYYSKYQDEPTEEYLAEKLNLSIDKIKKAKFSLEMSYVFPLNEQISTYNDLSKEVEEEEIVEKIKSVLSKLSKKEQLIIQLYYFEELSLREISEILDITESRISQIHKSVIRKIREEFNG